MQLLEKLKAGEPDTWNEVFRCLYPVAYEAARSKLPEPLLSECEDVAMEALSDVLDAATGVDSDEELKPLAAAIARNKAADRLRRHYAAKRGSNKLESLDAVAELGAEEPAGLAQTDFLDNLAVQELRALLVDLSMEVKKEYRVVLKDHFLDQLSYQEIADRRKISLGSVGVYLQRGLGSLRAALTRRPSLKAEFLAMLSDASAVRVLIPILGAVHAGSYFFADRMLFSLRPRPDDSELSDEQRLQEVSERAPNQPELHQNQRTLLMERVKSKYPKQYQEWLQLCEAHSMREEESKRRWKAKQRRYLVCGWMILIAVICGAAYGYIRLVQLIISR